MKNLPRVTQSGGEGGMPPLPLSHLVCAHLQMRSAADPALYAAAQQWLGKISEGPQCFQRGRRLRFALTL